MYKRFWDYFMLFGMAIVIIALDQWTKWLVRTNIELNQQMWAPWPWLIPYARIVNTTNTGAAFGMLQGFGGVFTVLAIIVILAILYYFPRIEHEDWPLRAAMGLQLGGALGNLIDRILQGHVTDFISIGRFAVFNIADASISLGVAVLIIGVWIKERQEKDKLEKLQAKVGPEPMPEEHNGE